MKKALLLLVAISPLLCLGQGYQIDISIGQLDSANLYLGYYMDGKTYVQDTAIQLEKGKYLFKGKESLSKGMYFLANSTTLMFDLVVGEDQFFELKTDDSDIIGSMEVVGDEDNLLFFQNMDFNYEMQKDSKPYALILKDSTSSQEEISNAQKELSLLNVKVIKYQNEIIEKFPESILGTLLNAGKNVEIPNELASGYDEGSRMKQYRYYKSHYWDKFDLGNPVLLRVPKTIYKIKIDEYLERLTQPTPDSIKSSVDKLIKLSSKNEVTYQYLTWYLTIKYQTSKIMGMDEIYVHIVDNYFLSGEMDFWANEILKNNLKEKADQLRNSLVGMKAPNLILKGMDEKPKSLNDVGNTYTVIYFYDPDCGHCKKETPVLKRTIDSLSYDIGVYSVSADSSMTKNQKYIEENGLEGWTNTDGTKTYSFNYQKVYDAYTTPTIYLLNDRKEIIAKKIAAKQLGEFIQKYEARE